MIEVGATVGNYRVEQKIGSGAMGSVYLASHPIIGKRVALKVIHPELATSEEMLARFFNEARAVTQIGHPNIVSVQDFGQTPDGDSFIIMELLEGRGLGELLKAEGPFLPARAIHIGAQIADGLQAAHARGIIHRDLKPDNIILVPRDGDADFVKVLDFGLAKLQGPGAQAMRLKTRTGSLLGTPHYMAPEQCEGKSIDARVDVYALGCILFHLLTGRVPFPGEGFGEVLVKHLREPPPLPSRLNGAVPAALERIVLHALAKKADFRFKSMAEFAQALRAPEAFARKLDAGTSGILTPPSGLAAAMPPADEGPPRLASARIRIAGDAPTMLAGEAPSEADVQRALALAQQAHAELNPAVAAPVVRRDPAAGHAAATVPSLRGDDQAVPRRRGPMIAVGAVLGLTLIAGAFWGVRALHPHAASIAITSDPSGAEVLSGDRSLGTTPITLSLPHSEQPMVLSLRKEGFLPAQRSVVPAGDQALAVRLLERPPPQEEPAPEPPPAPPPPVAARPPSVTTATQPAKAAPAKKHKKTVTDDRLLLQPSF